MTGTKTSIMTGIKCLYMDSLCSHHAEIQYLYLIYTVYNVIILPFHSCKKKRKGHNIIMKANTISGQRQYAFVSQFNYIREAGTKGEEKAACRIEKELSEIAEKWKSGWQDSCCPER